MVAFLQLLDSGNSSEKSPTHGSKIKSQFIATASIGAFNRRPLAGFAYSSSKAAVVHLIKQLATWLVPYQIRANVICPGVYPSEMLTVSPFFLLFSRGGRIVWARLMRGNRVLDLEKRI